MCLQALSWLHQKDSIPRFWAHWRTVAKLLMLLQLTARYVTLIYFALLYFTTLYLTSLEFTILDITYHFYFTSLCFNSLHLTSLYFILLYFTLHRPLFYFTSTYARIVSALTLLVTPSMATQNVIESLRERIERALVIFNVARTELRLSNFSCMGWLSGPLREYNVSGPCIVSNKQTLLVVEVSMVISDGEASMAHPLCGEQVRDIEKHSIRAFI